MQTVYDWVTLALFCAFATLFLHRSAGPAVAGDHVLAYVPAAIGCVAANLLGNAGQDTAAIAAIAATIIYGVMRLRPFPAGE